MSSTFATNAMPQRAGSLQPSGSNVSGQGANPDLAKEAIAAYKKIPQASNKNFVVANNDWLECRKKLGELAEAATKPNGNGHADAMKALVQFAARGDGLGSEACRALHDACGKVVDSEKPNGPALKQVNEMATFALEVYTNIRNEPEKVQCLPPYFLKIAQQGAERANKVQLAEEIGRFLAVESDNLKTKQDAARAEIEKVVTDKYPGAVTGGKPGKLMPTGRMIDLTGGNMTAKIRAEWFEKMDPDQQKPISFELEGGKFLHGFLHIDKKGTKHIVVWNPHGDAQLTSNFMTKLGLDEKSIKTTSIPTEGFKSKLSQPSLARLMFSYCAKLNPQTPAENIKKFDQYLVSLGPDLIDLDAAFRARRREGNEDSALAGGVLAHPAVQKNPPDGQNSHEGGAVLHKQLMRGGANEQSALGGQGGPDENTHSGVGFGRPELSPSLQGHLQDDQNEMENEEKGISDSRAELLGQPEARQMVYYDLEESVSRQPESTTDIETSVGEIAEEMNNDDSLRLPIMSIKSSPSFQPNASISAPDELGREQPEFLDVSGDEVIDPSEIEVEMKEA